MSNLGKVYVINIDRRQKDIYPVVYKNKDYLYCKMHGATTLTSFNTPEYQYSNTYEYEVFKEGYEKGEVSNSRTYTIYVPAHVKTFFEWIKEKSPLEKDIERMQESINLYDFKIKSTEVSISKQTKNLEDYKSQREEALEKLERLQKKLSEMNSSEV